MSRKLPLTMVVLPKYEPRQRQLTAHCQWCCQIQARKNMFKLVDGPIEYWFCGSDHAELWLEFRHKALTYHLCRMLPQERAAELGGQSMEERISALYPDLCDRSQS